VGVLLEGEDLQQFGDVQADMGRVLVLHILECML
jgi:hypothetical protein